MAKPSDGASSEDDGAASGQDSGNDATSADGNDDDATGWTSHYVVDGESDPSVIRLTRRRVSSGQPRSGDVSTEASTSPSSDSSSSASGADSSSTSADDHNS